MKPTRKRCYQTPGDIDRLGREPSPTLSEGLKRYLENSPDGIYVMDLKGNFLYVNRAAETILGYSRAELLGKSLLGLGLLCPEHLLKASRALELSATGKPNGPDEFELRRRDGKRVFVELSTHPVEEGERPKVMGVVRDVSQRKRIEEALRQREQDYLILLESTHDSIIVVDAERLKVVFGNRRSALMFGFDPVLHDAVGVNLLDFIHPEDKEIAMKGFVEDLYQRERRQRYDVRAKTKDGREIWVSALATRIEFQGRLAILLSLKDITQTKRAEEALEQSEELYAAMANSSQVGIYIVQDGKFVFVNPQFQKDTGFLADELLGTDPLRIVHPEDRETVREHAVKMLKGEPNSPYEYRATDKGGRTRVVVERVASIRYGGRPASMGCYMDITERKTAEAKLKQTMAELERSNKELQQFAYIASHDLQEPLRMVASYTQLLAERYKGKLDDKADLFINYAVDGTIRMQGLINDLLSYSRVTTRANPLKPADCKSVLVKALVNLSVAIKENDAIITSEDLPTVIADEPQMVQVFQNLLGNAIKFRREQQPRVHISAKEEGEEWVFSVEDNGIGIEPEYAERIFVLFQRLHSRSKYPGTGIGLTICKKIVERHGGRIWVVSKPGEGSKFCFTIPKRQIEHKNEEEQLIGVKHE